MFFVVVLVVCVCQLCVTVCVCVDLSQGHDIFFFFGLVFLNHNKSGYVLVVGFLGGVVAKKNCVDSKSERKFKAVCFLFPQRAWPMKSIDFNQMFNFRSRSVCQTGGVRGSEYTLVPTRHEAGIYGILGDKKEGERGKKKMPRITVNQKKTNVLNKNGEKVFESTESKREELEQRVWQKDGI